MRNLTETKRLERKSDKCCDLSLKPVPAGAVEEPLLEPVLLLHLGPAVVVAGREGGGRLLPVVVMRVLLLEGRKHGKQSLRGS